MRRSCGRQSYELLGSIRTVPITTDLSKAFCQFFSRFKKACCVAWSFLKPHNFGDKFFLTIFSICLKLSQIFLKLYVKTDLSEICFVIWVFFFKHWYDIGFFQLAWKISCWNTFINTAFDWYQNLFLANLIMAGNISPLELFLLSILFIYF